MLRFLLFVVVIVGGILFIKPELIDIAKEEMQMRERTNTIIEHNAPISVEQAIALLQENYPSVKGWTFTGVAEDLNSIIMTVSDSHVYKVATYKAKHDLNKLLQDNKDTAASLLCQDDTILNLLAHETIRSVYVQFYDKQGVDYGRVLIDNSDCGLWPFSMQRVIDKAF